MKKKFLLAFWMIIMASSGLQARSFDDIKTSGILKIGVPADYAPLAFYDEDKKLVGFDIDMIIDFTKSLNLKPEFVKTSWPTLSGDLISDQYDIAIGGVTYTEKRVQDFLLTQPIVPNGKIALANCNVVGQLTSLEAINSPDVKVAVNPGGTNELFVNENIRDQGAIVIPVPDNIQNLQMIRDQEADMMITDLIEGRYYQHTEEGVFCIANQSPFASTESYKVYMVKKENPILLDKINIWLDQVDIKSIAEKWDVQTVK